MAPTVSGLIRTLSDYRFLIVKARLVTAQDLGQSQEETSADDEQSAERVALIRTQTRASGFETTTDRSSMDGINYNLLSCVFIVLKEQGNLWKCFIIMAIVTLAGGKSLCLPKWIGTNKQQEQPTLHRPFYSHAL